MEAVFIGPDMHNAVSAFACGDSRPHNRGVAHTPWQQRIRRAQQLAGQHSFAAEILGFYAEVAGFQEALYRRIERACPKVDGGTLQGRVLAADAALSGAAQAEMLAGLGEFLSLVERKAPARLAHVAHELRKLSSSAWADLLIHGWANVDPPAEPEEFLALAVLQPYAELVRTQTPLPLENYSSALCPLCSRAPACSVLRPLGDGGRRSLLCGFCVTEWEFRRIVCPGCGQEDHAKLPVYTAAELPHIRVECCDVCQTYVKSIDLTKNGLAEPLVDELAAVPLDLWAQERGYAKLRLNLLGM